jgi:hypothetical protein
LFLLFFSCSFVSSLLVVCVFSQLSLGPLLRLCLSPARSSSPS